MFKTYFAQFEVYIAVALLLVSFFAGGWLAWKYQQSKIDALQVRHTACTEANATNNATINNLTADVTTANIRCKSQLAARDRTIRELKKIDDLKGGSDAVPGDHNGGSGNYLLDAANSVFARPGYTDGVR